MVSTVKRMGAMGWKRGRDGLQLDTYGIYVAAGSSGVMKE